MLLYENPNIHPILPHPPKSTATTTSWKSNNQIKNGTINTNLQLPVPQEKERIIDINIEDLKNKKE